MKYSEPFEQLLVLSYETESYGHVRAQYKRVAIYIGRVMMAETAVPREQYLHRNLDSPITTDFGWVDEVAGHKEQMLGHVINITDREWKIIHGAMIGYANASRGSDVWTRKRMGMIHQLDTLRAFNS